MDNSLPSLLSWAQAQLTTTSPTPRLDAEVLLAHQLDLSRSHLLTSLDLRPPQLHRFRKLIEERRAGKPVAYLTGEKEFYGRSFLVDDRVLIPRPETELLVELALKKITATRLPLTVVDLGTGSGNIIVSLAAELKGQPNLRLIATDTSAKALEVAKLNARRHGVLDRISFLEGSLLEPLSSLVIDHSKLVILTNLPYVADHWVKDLAPDIKYFEPNLALAGGPSGLELYAQLFRQIAGSRLTITAAFCEHDPRQLQALQALASKYYARPAISHVDLAQLPRVLEIPPA